MVVQVRVAHRRSIDNHRLIQHVAIALRDALQFVQEIRQHRDVILVDQVKIFHAFFRAAMMRRRMERFVRAAFGVRATGPVATHLEGEHPRHIRREGERLNIKHELHVFAEGIGHAGGCLGQRARFAAAVARFNPLYATLHLANVFEIPIETLLIGGAQRRLERRHLAGDKIENAPSRATTLRTFRRRATHAEQLLERHAGVPNHRQWIAR